jgi:FAS-associated factor 2
VGWHRRRLAQRRCCRELVKVFRFGTRPPFFNTRFSKATAATNSYPHSSNMEPFKIDDSEQGGGRRRVSSSNVDYMYLLTVQQPPTSPWYPTVRPSLLTVLAFPFHVLSSIFRFLLGVLRIPIPQFRFSNLNFYRPLRPGPRRGPDTWLRELEEETGALCISRAKSTAGISTATGVAGPSTLTSRAGNSAAIDESRKLLPDFVLGSYEEFVRICQKDVKIGCVVLVSEEHDDVADFKRCDTIYWHDGQTLSP